MGHIMKLIIFMNETFEEEEALVDLETGKVILYGDHYHDKIGPRIEGYLQALYDFGTYTADVRSEWITPDHEYFEKCNFYNGE